MENNKSTASAENVERELHTQKEIFAQYEKSKKEVITRLQSELTTIEDKYQHRINWLLMECEDSRSSAYQNAGKYHLVKLKYEEATR